jgi:hypothetical protein
VMRAHGQRQHRTRDEQRTEEDSRTAYCLHANLRRVLYLCPMVGASTSKITNVFGSHLNAPNPDFEHHKRGVCP